MAPGCRGRGRVEGWFAARGWTPWPFQREAWDAYAAGKSGLVQVATGAGKTYAAYLGPLAELIDEIGDRAKGVEGLRVLFVTPLRAVSRDIELALKEPVVELGLPVLVESRTGDTKASVRAKQRTRLPNVLITTPESLTLMLTRQDAAEKLGAVRAVIVDEWHELMASKRGTQTELALARLRRFAPGMRTWGMSATLPNLEEAAAALGGTGSDPAVVRGAMERRIIVDSILPVKGRLPWAGHLGLSMLPDVVAALDPSVSTLIFTNTRSQAERWFHAILVQRPEWAGVMALHHGSIDREEREAVEGGLKSGALRIVVATSSLDLGVDFSPVERVMQIGSPKGIARIMQRAGRASHRPMASARVTCVPTHGMELFEIAAARRATELGEVESRHAAQKPLDVLAQHLVTCGLGGGFMPEELFEEVKSAYSYRDLTRQEFDWALALMSNGGGTLAAYPEFHRVIEGPDGRLTVPSARIAQLHRLNVGTIVGDTTVEIRYMGGRSLGRIEENFITGLRVGEQFVFAGKVLRFVMFQDLVAYVRAGSGTTNYTPIWGGTRLPISESLAESIREALERAGAGTFDSPELQAARAMVGAQARMSRVPRADEVLAEECSTREGTHLFAFPFEGRLVNGGVASILALRMSRTHKATFSVAVNDYGFEILCAEPFPFLELLTPAMFTTERLVEDAAESVNISELAKMQFREVARVAGLVFQTYPGSRKTARQVQAGSGLLYDVLLEHDPANLLLAQARREVLEKHFEQSRLARTLERLGSATMVKVEVERPTPLGFPLLIERLAARLTSESILDRIEKMKKHWGVWDEGVTGGVVG